MNQDNKIDKTSMEDNKMSGLDIKNKLKEIKTNSKSKREEQTIVKDFFRRLDEKNKK